MLLPGITLYDHTGHQIAAKQTGPASSKVTPNLTYNQLGAGRTQLRSTSGGGTDGEVRRTRAHGAPGGGARCGGEGGGGGVRGLVNMIGGNLKCLLPEPSELSLPTVSLGAAHVVTIPGARLLQHVELACDADRLHIAVWNRREDARPDLQAGLEGMIR